MNKNSEVVGEKKKHWI